MKPTFADKNKAKRAARFKELKVSIAKREGERLREKYIQMWYKYSMKENGYPLGIPCLIPSLEKGFEAYIAYWRMYYYRKRLTKENTSSWLSITKEIVHMYTHNAGNLSEGW